MKSRIEELAQRIYMDEGGMPSMELRCEVITTAVNEALELAAKECEKSDRLIRTAHDAGIVWEVKTNRAEAIRKLKCS